MPRLIFHDGVKKGGRSEPENEKRGLSMVRSSFRCVEFPKRRKFDRWEDGGPMIAGAGLGHAV